MKAVFPILFVLLLSVITSSTLSAQSVDEEAIKAVVQKETNSYYTYDAEGWASTWLQEANTTREIVSSSNHYSVEGWSNFGPQMKASISENKPDNPSVYNIEFNDFITHASGDVAWLQYKQVMTRADNPEFKRVSTEYRTLVNKDGNWKIASQVTVDPETYDQTPDAIESSLVGIASRLFQAGEAGKAMALMEQSAEFYPESAMPHYIMGAIAHETGKGDAAIEHLHKALELNPEHANAKSMLDELMKEGTN